MAPRAAEDEYGNNFLIPVNASLTSSTELPLIGVRLGDIIKSINATAAKANLIIIDACPAWERIAGHGGMQTR